MDIWKNSSDNFRAIADALGVDISSPGLLCEALTHRSAAAEWNHGRTDGIVRDNERLEFLGDAVIDLVLSAELFRRSDISEGKLSKIRASLVCESSLANMARKIDLGDYLILSRGEELGEGRQKDSILADAFESLVGAIYVDQGIDAAREFILNRFARELAGDWQELMQSDFKSRLQELSQERYQLQPEYEVIGESGPDHSKQFQVAVHLKGKRIATGSGGTKKRASQIAAERAYLQLSSREQQEGGLV